MHAPFGVSPSALARYFFHDCDRFLRFRSTRRAAAHGVPERRHDSGPTMRAVLASGHAWEEQVITQHLADRVIVADGAGDLSDRTWTVPTSIEQLRSAQPGQYLYQLTLRAPPSLYEALGIRVDDIEIRDNRPDLVEVLADSSGARLFRIIDIKRGASVRLPYRIQVLFYALELQHILRTHSIPGSVDLAVGAAWLGGASRPEEFELAPVRPHLMDLLRRLPRLMELPLDKVDWHLRFRCEWCEYLDYCRNEAVDTNNVSRLAGLSAHGKRFLARTFRASTLPELAGVLARPGVDHQLQACASLAGERPRLQARLEAHARQEPRPFGSIHPGLPIGENVAIFLTVQAEPVQDRVWLLGMLVHARPELRLALFKEEGRPRPFVAIAHDERDCNNVMTRFVRRLHQVLVRVDLWNQRRPVWQDKLTVQLYCYSEQEKARLVGVLMAALHKADLADSAMALLFHIQAPDLLHVDDHPSEILCFPLIPLVSALGRLLALAVDVSYTLPETLAALGSTFDHRRSDRFHYPFGHGVRADDIQRAWQGQEVDLQRTLREAAARLFAYRAVLRSLRQQAGDGLVDWPPKHRLLSSAGIQHPRLSRLAFLARYESILGCLRVRDQRCEARELAAANGKLIPLEHLGGGRFRVTTDGVVVDPSEFTRWLVVRDTVAGQRAQARFNDWAHRSRFWGGRPDRNVGTARVTGVETDDVGFAHTLDVRWDRQHEPELEEGGEFLLMPRFLDFNTEKLLTGLARLDASGGLFVDLLDDPAAADRLLPLPGDTRISLATSLSRLGLTPSQAKAFTAICRHQVSAVWGPPGTGKTHFLASMILAFCEAHRDTGRPLRVLVTAMTHTAIDNVMRKLVQRAEEIGASAPRMGKVGRWTAEMNGGVASVPKEHIDSWLGDGTVSVLGGTAWALSRSRDSFDLVVIDEASQVKVSEAALVIERIGSTGRLVTAGDHLQLGPILTGVYPEAPDGEPALSGSVFDLLRERPGRAGAPVSRLLENWRMCNVLTSAARVLYGSDYRCATSEVAGRRLNLAAPKEGIIGAILAPSQPMVVVIISGVQAARVNVVEAELVAKVAVALRDSLEGPLDDEEFWSDRLFIVSPHHAQIRAIQAALRAARQWSQRPFVDTVDKMQGQEADTVLISYGVSDPEYAAMEADFIYAQNRLNVAFTRARAKVVLCLPRPLLEASPEVLDSATVADGLAYMRGLVDHARRGGSSRVFDLRGGVAAEVISLSGPPT